jgi:hypothetical protein
MEISMWEVPADISGAGLLLSHQIPVMVHCFGVSMWHLIRISLKEIFISFYGAPKVFEEYHGKLLGHSQFV